MNNSETFESYDYHLRILLFLLACLSMALMLIYRMGPNIVDYDIWHEMALIRRALDLGFIPYQDHFAYTKTVYPSVHHEWGAGLVAYFLSSSLGASGIVFLRYMLTSILILSLIYSLRKRKVNLPIILFFLPLPIFIWSYGTLAVRAQMYSYVFTALLLIFFDFNNCGHRWWIPIWLVLYTIWLNLHGGFLVGLGLTTMYCFEQITRNRPYRHILTVLIIMIALIVVNPYGIHYYPYILNAVTMKRPHVAEWSSIFTCFNSAVILSFIILFLLSGYALSKRGFKNTQGIFLLLVTTIVSINTSRILPFYAIIWIHFVPSWIQTTSLGKNIDSLYRNRKFALIGIYLLILVVFSYKIALIMPSSLQVPNSKRPEWGEHAIYPVGAVEYLRINKFKGNILVPFECGAYITWELYPNVKVSLDGRYEVTYPRQVAEEQYDLYMGSYNWKELLRKYAPDIILTNVRLPLAKLIDQSAEWKTVYTDDQWKIYAQNSSDLPYEIGSKNFYSGKFP